jgi:hypothetical protein
VNRTVTSSETDDFDIFTARYDWDMDYYNCLLTSEYRANTIANVQTRYGGS